MSNKTIITSMLTADTFGVVSCLYELGGLIVMHDASGCNSTYTTHDEPRWGIKKSDVYISALTELDAISGNDMKLIDDVVEVSKNLNPKFIMICTTPIPIMVGFDHSAVAKIIEEKTGIRTYCVNTTGMEDYTVGIEKGYDVIFDLMKSEEGSQCSSLRIGDKPLQMGDKKEGSQCSPLQMGGNKEGFPLRCNIIGLTPLDYYYNVEDEKLKNDIKKIYDINTSLTVGCDYEDIYKIKNANKNIVVSKSGIKFAEKLKKELGIDYDIGIVIKNKFFSVKNEILDINNINNNKDKISYGEEDYDIIIINEIVKALSIKKYLNENKNLKAKVLYNYSEIEILDLFKERLPKAVIADGLYEPICKNTKFINFPHVAFSGRIYNNVKKTVDDIVDEL